MISELFSMCRRNARRAPVGRASVSVHAASLLGLACLALSATAENGTGPAADCNLGLVLPTITITDTPEAAERYLPARAQMATKTSTPLFFDFFSNVHPAPYSMERVEIIRGPGSTIFARARPAAACTWCRSGHERWQRAKSTCNSATTIASRSRST